MAIEKKKKKLVLENIFILVLLLYRPVGLHLSVTPKSNSLQYNSNTQLDYGEHILDVTLICYLPTH